MLPVVALVGRPNVGKSTLFNRLIGYRKAIVEDTPGVTRDRLYGITEWTGVSFNIIDTGGIQMGENDKITSGVRYQAELAVEESDVILFLVDGRQGVTPLDEEIADLIRVASKNVIVVVNKVDTLELEENKYDFYAFGFDKITTISAANALGIGDLLDDIVDALPKGAKDLYDDDTIRVAIVGKPNVGKSSLTNKILGKERVIVSDIPGTTRDAIDSFFEYEEDKFIFIDTAGLRRKSRVHAGIERYSVVRTLKAVDRSDIVLVLIDATEGVTEQDKKIAGYAHEQGRGCILVINKWDLVEKDHRTMDEQRFIIYSELPFLQYAPIIFISAKTGQRVHKLLELIKYVSEQQMMRISTSMMNVLLEEITFMTPPPSDKGKQLRIYYGTQVGVKPPKFILFVNEPDLMHFSYKRYIENMVRETYGFEGTPIWFKIKRKK